MKSKKYPTAPEPLVTLQHAMFQAVAQFYLFAYYINIPEKTFQRMEVFKSDIHNAAHTGRYEEEREWFVTKIVDPAFQAKMRAFTDLHTLEARIHDEILYQDYRNCNDRWVRAAFIPAAWDEVGHLTHVLLTGQNIDESHRKETEHQRQMNLLNEQLRQKNIQVSAQLDTVLSGISGGYVVTENRPGYPFTYISPAVTRSLGYQTEQEFRKAVHGNSLESIWPADRAHFEKSFHRQLAQGDTYSVKYRMICKDGHTKWVMDSGKRDTEPDGRQIFRSLLLDIDRHEKVSQMYKAERTQYRDALLNDCEYALTIDMTDQVIEKSYMRRNDPSLPLVGYQLPMKLNQHLRAVWNDFELLDSSEKLHAFITPERVIRDFENGVRNQDVEYYDSKRDMYLRATILLSRREQDAHVLAIIIGRDITAQTIEQEQARKELEDTNEKLKKACLEAELANAAKSDFLARMSHDIRTPLNGILGLLEISGRCADDPVRVEDCRKKAVASANHLLSLLNDVLDMSKLESGQLILAEEPFDMNDLLLQVHEIMESQMQAKNIRSISLWEQPLAHPQVIGSPVHVRQILTNLVSNAIKYNKEGGTISAGMEEISCDSENITFRFTISDTGIGMSEAFLQHIFEPFSRENEGITQTAGGTGLGMSIVKKLIEKMKGTIEIHSQKDVGSTFIITLPFRRDTTQHARPEENAGTDTDLRDLRILLVEDNALNSEVAQYLLTDEGALVDTAADGKEAVDVFTHSSAHTYDVILMDMMMPVMDGCTATRIIRGLDRPDARTIPIIALTANAFSDDISKCRAAGMNAHLSKPLNMKTVKTVIRRFT